MNKCEIASSYTHKKSVGRNNAFNPENPSSQDFMNDRQSGEKELKYNQGDINGQTGNRTNTNETSTDGLYGTRPSEPTEGISRPNTGRSYDSSSDNGIVIHKHSPEFKQELEAEGKPVNNYKELAANSDEDAASFISNFRASNEVNGKNAAQVYEYSPEEYKQMRLFSAENGKSGFAIKSNGDIVSVFSDEKKQFKRCNAISYPKWWKKLDYFDTFLPKIYKKFGFVEVKREKWNEQFKPSNWDK
jgi:hypothetical protein